MTHRLQVHADPFILHSPFSIPSPDVDRRAARRVGLGLAQHLVGHRRDVALAEEDVAHRYASGLPSVQPK